ncbi:MAG: hypothetical protein WBN62_05505, partial [Thermoanaerobaculia bacterium]
MFDSNSKAHRVRRIPVLTALLMVVCLAPIDGYAQEVPARVLAIGDSHSGYESLDARLAAFPPPGPESEGAKTPNRVFHGPDGAPLPFQTVSEVEEFLRTANVVDVQLIGEGVTKPK